MNNTPILEFKNNKEFQKYCKFYQHFLFLDDWFIKFKMVDKIDLPDNNDNYVRIDGQCLFDFNSKSAVISIVNKSLYDEEINSRTVVECVIIHELLHLKVEYWKNSLSISDNEDMFGLLNHQYMEQMAKSILMLRYNLDYDYFMGEDNGEKEKTTNNT